MSSTKVQQKSVTTKLRLQNLYFLIGCIAFGFAAYVAYALNYWGVGFLCVLVSVALFYLLLSPTIRWLPHHRHAVNHLSICGRAKEIRLIRLENSESYYPCIFTPQTEKSTVQATVNQRLVKNDSGGIRLEAQIAPQDVFVQNGSFHAVVFDDIELTEKCAVFVYCCLLVRSKNDTLFEAAALRKYLQSFSPVAMFAGSLLIGFVFFVASVHYFGHLLNAKSSYPTLSKVVQKAKKRENTAMALRKNLIGKEVTHE